MSGVKDRNEIMKKNFSSRSLALCSLRFARPLEAQQPKKVPRIGYLSARGDPNNPGPTVEAFRQGLRDLGYIEGKNIAD